MLCVSSTDALAGSKSSLSELVKTPTCLRHNVRFIADSPREISSQFKGSRNHFSSIGRVRVLAAEVVVVVIPPFPLDGSEVSSLFCRNVGQKVDMYASLNPELQKQ